MNNKKPELYRDDKGHPKGYRVGIADGVYGTCPFCGKSYTEEDVKNGDVNFEHVFPRFAAKKAVGEEKVFSKIESEFMVAVHKDCNDRYGQDLEKRVGSIINNLNKRDVSLTKKDAKDLVNYCIKTDVFLRYLFLWDDINGQSVYEDEKLDINSTAEYKLGKSIYEYFDVRIRHVDTSAGLWWGIDLPNYAPSQYCFTTVLNGIEISFFPSMLSEDYTTETCLSKEPKKDPAIFIERFGNKLILLHSKEYNSFDSIKYHSRQGISWTLPELLYPSYRKYNNHIETLSSAYDYMFGVSSNYFIRQRKLSIMNQKQFESLRVLDQQDRGVAFCRENIFYFVDNDGIVQNMADLPNNTEIPNICFRKLDIQHLPDISKLKITGNIIINNSSLESLDGCPQVVQGSIYVSNNKLTSLQGTPKYIGKSFVCGFNELTSLAGAPTIINGDFSCENNRLSNLIGGPAEVKGAFMCGDNQLTSLAGAPRKVGGNFWGIGNKLKSLHGAPEEIGGFFSFNAKNLESLDGLPKAQSYMPAEVWKEFHSVDELRAWFVKYKKEQKTKEMRDGAKVIDALRKAGAKNKSSGIPDDQYGM